MTEHSARHRAARAGRVGLDAIGPSPAVVVLRAAALPLVLLVGAAVALLAFGVDRDLVLITYAVTSAALGFGLALAFGLGGRELARTLLEDAHAASVWRSQAERERSPADARDGEFASA